MHILFVHKEFPRPVWGTSLATHQAEGLSLLLQRRDRARHGRGIHKIQYSPSAARWEQSLYYSRTFDNAVGHSAGIYKALKPLVNQVRPDLIVGHSGLARHCSCPNCSRAPGDQIL